MSESTVDAAPAAAKGSDRAALLSTACALLIVALLWHLFREFAAILRPLFLAAFVCYVIVPIHLRLKRWVPSLLSIMVLVGVSVAALYLMVQLMAASAANLMDDLPQLSRRARELVSQIKDFGTQHFPWLVHLSPDEAATWTEQLTQKLRGLLNAFIASATDAFFQAVIVGFYLLFLLVEAGRFPARLRSGFVSGKAERILEVSNRVNDAMARFLRVKVQASLALALPVTLILTIFGVPSPVMWGVLTFIANFVPYIGSIVACALPLLLAFFQLEPLWQPISVGVLLIALHVVSGYVVEPAMTGKAVGLSPLIILVGLAFWGQCWGLTGMFLAVPLTVMLRIILANIELTKPFARLMGDD